MERNGKAPYATDHLYLSAFLCCQGHRLVGTEPDENGRTHFLFADSNELRSSIAEFMGGGLVDAREFSFTLLKLKKYLPKPRMEKVTHVGDGF